MLRHHVSQPAWLVFYIPVSVLLRLVESTCYTQNGTETEDLISCNATAKISACCQRWDFCLSNGMCRERLALSYMLGGCTDPEFNGPCVSQCDVDDTFLSPVFDVAYCRKVDEGDVFLCNGRDCNAHSATVFTEPAATSTYPPITDIPSASPTKTVTVTATLTEEQTLTTILTSQQTVTATLTQTTAINPPGPSAHSQNVQTGLAVGLALSLAATAGLLAFVCWRRWGIFIRAFIDRVLRKLHKPAAHARSAPLFRFPHPDDPYQPHSYPREYPIPLNDLPSTVPPLPRPTFERVGNRLVMVDEQAQRRASAGL
ncbi:hypothetical protein ANO14919_097800 [Xylariales sp. No.14919]|nr:hypothetical protein ANO14919_097800 [Xylariales sp. No.14919]